MTLEYECKLEGDYLHVVSVGSVYSVDYMVEYIISMFEKLTQAGISKLLVDETKFHFHMGVDDLREVSKRLDEQDHTRPSVAVVSSNMNHPLFQHVFPSGDRIRIFSEIDLARRWLAEK